MIPEHDRSKKTTQKVLGIIWNAERDNLVLKCDVGKVDKTTKRSILKQHARIFDPLGFLTPLTIRSKAFIQELWKKGYQWDVELDKKDRRTWEVIREGMNGFEHEIPRKCVVQDSETRLVIFTDASTLAQAACAYMVSGFQVHLILARSKVNDMKGKETIPKLELNAIMLGLRMAVKIVSEIKTRQLIAKVILFTDSEIALGWVQSESSPDKAGSVTTWELLWKSDMCALISIQQIALLELKKEDFNPHRWWCGPEFLKQAESDWNEENKTRKVTDKEGVKINALRVEETTILTERSWKSLRFAKRVVATCLKFVANVKKRIEERKSGKKARPEKKMWKMGGKHPDNVLRGSEIAKAKMALIKMHQEGHGVSDNESRKRELRMFMDKDGIWKCQRRLGNSEQSSANRPIFVKPNTTLARLIIQEAHETRCEHNLHLSEAHTMTEVRKEFWIPQLRAQVKTIKRKCVQCKRFSTMPFRYPEATDLPSRRVQQARTFQHIGLDNFGPLDYRKEDNSRGKGYGLILTCAVTRMIHLELARI
ncbi:hypothetical protein L596_010497 [Steinernema carpocapsae]|uniref:Integrase zinc-binding domain-containing protein n=1 Tax=Steinernema carpocapsae TaxID=34508 RepID=A0A4U5PIG9_STECR|nr:hypothetical protein L596_010497 [Steinernema carpocapsae]